MNWTIRDYLEVAAMVSPILVSAALWWLSRRFAAKGSLVALARKTEEIEQKLAAGESRFGRMESAIHEVSTAAQAAKSAADEAAKAAERIHEVQIGITALQGEMKTLNAKLAPLEHFGRVLLEGHLKLGGQS